MNGMIPVRVVGPRLWRQALERLLASLPGVCVISELFPTSEIATPQVTAVVLLLGLSTLAVQEYLRQQGCDHCVLVTNEKEMRLPLFQQTILSNFVGEQEETTILLDAIQRAARNEAYCSPTLIAALISTAQSTHGPTDELAMSLSPLLARLSLREREVASYVLEGWSNEQIANHLHISVATVKFHLVHAYRKLGISRRTELRTAIEQFRNAKSEQAKPLG